ncbi:MAG TPA: hypothetical protein VK737_02265 [Opitutales bacterium]|nr:hypothetical protein [Opitutales bacterium]
MKTKLRLVFGIVSLLALGAVVYLRASATNSISTTITAPAPAGESSCCGPDPASVLPIPYITTSAKTDVDAKVSSAAQADVPAKN